MKRLLALLGLLLLVAIKADAASTSVNIPIVVTSGAVGSSEEFVGPFPTWACVRSSASGTCGAATAHYYNAVADGSTDDTTVIQSCLDAIVAGTYPYCYFPSGNYKITSTLTLTGPQQYIGMIGQDPSNTTILWYGASSGTMLSVDGIAYSKFDRLTLDGRSIAGTALSLDFSTGDFPTGNEIADTVLKNSGYGFDCGETAGCSEVSILRSQFLNDTIAGIFVANANALDIWVWYSVFTNDGYGITNNTQLLSDNRNRSGAYNVSESIFTGSTATDIGWGNVVGPFSFRNNYSSGSNYFVHGGGSGHTAPMIISGNTVLDTTQDLAILMSGAGAMVLSDNIVRSQVGAAGPIAKVQSGNPQAGMFSIGNTFTVSPSTAVSSNTGSSFYHSFLDTVVSRGSITPSAPVLPGTPPNNGRTIYEATNVSQIVSGIASAAGTCNNSVVHIQPGSYSVATTITVPANCAIQIIGDGSMSHLSANGADPVLDLQGPSKVTLRDFLVTGNSHASAGIVVENADQVGSSIFLEQAIVSHSRTNVHVDSLDYTNVEFHDFHNLYNGEAASVGPGLKVTGGAQAAMGNWKGGSTKVFSALGSGNWITWQALNGARLAVLDTWYDTGAAGSHFLNMADVTGNGVFTYGGAGAFIPDNVEMNTTALSLHDFTGTAAIVDFYTTGTILLTGSGSGGNVLSLGLSVTPTTSEYSDTTSPSLTTELLNSIVYPDTNTYNQFAEQNCCTQSFLVNTLAQMRSSVPSVPSTFPSGITDVRFYRVSVDSASTGIHLKAN